MLGLSKSGSHELATKATSVNPTLVVSRSRFKVFLKVRKGDHVWCLFVVCSVWQNKLNTSWRNQKTQQKNIM